MSSVMRRLARAAMPRWERLEKGNVEASVEARDEDLVDRAMSWWKTDAFTRMPRLQKLRWLGRTWWTRTIYRTILGDYWRPAHDTVGLIEAMQAAEIVPALGTTQRIFEGGCNVGRNLFYLQDRFDCDVVGLDISAGAIAEAG